MALPDQNSRIEAATTQLEADVKTVTSSVSTVTTASTNSALSASQAASSALASASSASQAKTSENAAKAHLDAIGSKGYIGEAPKDDNQYARKNGSWAIVTGAGGSGGGGDVASVNGKIGVVVLDAQDVKALPEDTKLFSGDYNDLTNKPSGETFSGSYNDLTDKPTYAKVATSGSYTDLVNKPTILAEAPLDGKQYARTLGKWSEITEIDASNLVNPNVTGYLSLNNSNEQANGGLTLSGSYDKGFKINIPSIFEDETIPEARLVYSATDSQWQISAAGGNLSQLVTEADLKSWTPTGNLPFTMNTSLTSNSALGLRFANYAEGVVGTQVITKSDTIMGALIYDGTTNKKWCVRNDGSKTSQPIATEAYVTNAISNIPSSGGSGSGAQMGRSNGQTSADAWTQFQKILQDGSFSMGNTFAAVDGILSANGWAQGGSFVVTTKALAATAALNLPENTAGTVKVTLMVNRDATGALTSYDMEWKRIGGSGWFFKENINASNFKGNLPWKSVNG